MFKHALDLLETVDTFACIDFLNQQVDIDQALKIYGELAALFYNQRKDIHRTVMLACAGVQHGLASAHAAEADTAYQRRSSAKSLAYNLASYTWPGWDEAGIQLDRGYLRIGLDAAYTNLRLAEELEKGALPMGRAYWLLGAQHLAAEDSTSARSAFVESARFARLAGHEDEALLAEGFGLLVDRLERPGSGPVAGQLESIKAALGQHEHGTFFITQLETALHVFAGNSSK